MMHPQLLLQKQSRKRKGEGSDRRLGASNLVVVFLPYLNKCLI
jgi:stalled ribosome alternative rescue factor ArfA